MPDLDLTAYRATYDPEAWARVIEQYPTTDARTQLLVPACLAIRALCDEVERLRRGDSTCVDDDGTPFASARYWRAANSEACKRLLKASNALTDALARAEKAEREMDDARAEIARLQAERAAWKDTAAQHARNEEFWHDLVMEAGKHLGPEVYTQDDGGIVDRPLALKVPGCVAALKSRAEKAERALNEAQAMLDAVRGRAEQNGIQPILDVLDKEPSC
jgi:uncharacterized protein YdcH (DUF465 family)